MKHPKLNFLKKGTLFTSTELEKNNISSAHITYLVKSGKLNRIGYGLYETPDRLHESYSTLVEVCKRIPEGVICLLTALSYYNLTTQAPPDIWVAVKQGSWKPIERRLPVKIVIFSEEVFKAGIVHFTLEGVPVKMYSPAKTVADCFKYRTKVGLDIAIEGLREGIRERAFSISEFRRYAKICRVPNIIVPYLQSFTI